MGTTQTSGHPNPRARGRETEQFDEHPLRFGDLMTKVPIPAVRLRTMESEWLRGNDRSPRHRSPRIVFVARSQRLNRRRRIHIREMPEGARSRNA